MWRGRGGGGGARVAPGSRTISEHTDWWKQKFPFSGGPRAVVMQE